LHTCWSPQGRILEALDAASRAAAIAPGELAHAGFVAQLQERIGRYDAACRTLEGALARRPTASALHGQQARVLERMGDLPAAARAFETVLRLKADDGPALSQLVFLRKQLGDWHDLAALQARFRAGVAVPDGLGCRRSRC
jgi:tetratricopeptide (TPR) repeat protein